MRDLSGREVGGVGGVGGGDLPHNQAGLTCHLGGMKGAGPVPAFLSLYPDLPYCLG